MKGGRDSSPFFRPDGAETDPAMRNIRLTIEYDGGAYCGWQRQINGLSIQQVLEECIGRVTGEEIRVIGSGRTDAGVHALHQVANFHTASRLAERSLLMGINSLLPADIVVKEICERPLAFHSCFDASEQGVPLPDLQPAGSSCPGEKPRLVPMEASRPAENGRSAPRVHGDA